MDINQREILETLEQLTEAIKAGLLPTEMLPVPQIKTLFLTALETESEEKKFEEGIADRLEELLEYQVKNRNQWMCWKLTELLTECAKWAIDLQDRQMAEQLLYDEIVEQYGNKLIDETFINEHTYMSLVQLKKSGNISLFKEISRHVFETALGQIRKKKNRKIVFLLKDSAEWGCEAIYQKLCRIPEIEIEFVVAPFLMGTRQTITDTYLKTIEYFKKKGKTTGIYNMEQDRYMSWKEIGMPDIVIHLNPHYEAFSESADICNFPLSVLNIYIPYGVLIYGNTEHQFNQMSHMLYWKIFCESQLHKEMAGKYSDIGDINVVNSGYVKMDTFYTQNIEEINEKDIWKIADGADRSKVKKIIYAPHWSVKDAFTGFGNFDKIYKEIYEYVKANQETTSWILRPHPMLRAGCVKQKIFADEKEFDAYLALWNALPNARVIEGGTYQDIFQTSDAMVLDSISFLAEYLYVNKPMLFLTKEKNTFNDFGKELVKVLYKTDGGNFDGVINFIQDVVIGGNDYMKSERETFFEKYMDYKKINGELASDYICRYILEQTGWQDRNGGIN